jgi:tetratricopeptide (TPR) repeat protein
VRRLLDSYAFWGLMVFTLVTGIALVIFSVWISPLAKGDRAVAEGQLDAALEYFASAESRFQRYSLARQLLPQAYRASQDNQFHILYKLGEYDTLFEKTSSESALVAGYFWIGSAAFNLATEQTEPDSKIVWYERAVQEFRSALELEPDSWDIKYNFELSERLLAELRDEAEPPPDQLPELLRPQPQQGEIPFQPLG